ncbi:MipA/OmpV family protein [Xanthomonas albilineans]|uniref:MipA/OmpV family protein n=1 Tax=Xanthomonas albilineans TaxID=29447 RepID=UPI0005F35917|nr:MipA/OmpV family protein [Xanthomonas albilineans]PPU91919.1 MipA/OmpV family protein [Xanthomonas albilineans]
MNPVCSALSSALAVAMLALPICVHATDADIPSHAANAGLFGDKTELSIGAGAMLTPRYAGSADDRLQGVPVFSLQRGIVFVDSVRGAGVQFQNAHGFSASQSFYYDLGRLQRNSAWRPGSARLAGMGDVPGTITARSFVMQQLTPSVALQAEAEFALKESARRNRYRAGAQFTLLHTPTDNVTMDLNAHWGDRRFNQSYFGVDAAQSAASNFRPYRADAGMYAYSVGADWDHTLSPHWTVSLLLNATRYVGATDGSPVVQRHAFASIGATMTYTR